MKKKLLLTLIITLMACMLMFTLSACGDKTPQITRITVSGQAEVYIDEFDYADYTITATYDNGTTENVTLQAEHLSAEDNAKISTVGTHTLNVTYSGKTATLSLTVKSHDFDGVTFEDKTVTYNGLPQTIEVSGLPSGANVNYSPNNTYTEVGEYPVTATITKQYYNDLQLTATLKITDIIRKITFVQAGVEDIVKEVVDGGTLSENEIPTPQEVNGYEVKWNRTEFLNITSDITVEIEKSLKTFNITYVLNGGTNHIDNPKEFTIESPNLALYTPEKAIGATFAGWYTNSAFTDESKITEIKSGSYGDKTIYAKWLDYRIENADGFTIDYNQQPALVSMTVPYTTENIDLNSRFTISKGCTWKLFSDFTGNYEFPLKAMTLNVGENKAYIIVFHPDGEHFTRYLLNIYRLDMKEYAFMNGLSVWKDGEIQERSELSAPTTNPEKTGYTFGGWAVDGNKVEFPYTVTEDVIFTAIFIPIEYDIVYNLNNGELNTNKTKYTIEQYFNFDVPTRDYYDFSGWFNNTNFDGNAITGISIGTYGKITLYAKWTPIDYFIDYEENGGTNDENNPTEYNVETATITLKNPTKDGFTFNGWYKESTFNTKVTQIVKGSHGNIKFYAKWTENVNGLNFDGNGNTSGTITAIALKTGETKAIPLNTFVKTGYTFKGWATSANGSVVYNDGANYTMGTASQYTIYAVWEANLNTLIFNGNGANGGSTSSMQIRTDASKALNANGFTRTKYLFAGWAESANGAVKYTDGATYTMGTNASYTLYAVWTLNENEITFNGNGNTSGSMPNQTVYNNGNKVLNNNSFAKTGYHFIGWAESADGVVKYIDGETATFVQKENYTLYAKWEANLNTLTFNGNGNTGGATSSIQIRSDATATLNQNGFTKTGYTFKGWSTSKNGEVEYLNGASYTMGLNPSYTLYAVWEENVNGLNFDGNGNTSGSMTAIALKTGETKAIPLNTFVKAGYHFIGWAESKDGEVVYNNGETYTMGTNSQYTLYAVWVLNENIIVFNGNGATSGTMDNQIIYKDSYIVLQNNEFHRTGYHFIGWAESADGDVLYDDEATITFQQKEIYTLYAVWAEGSDGLTYSLSNEKYSVIGYEGVDTTIIIPSIYNGYPVTSIGYSAFRDCSSFTSIVIGNSVTSIGAYAFYYCDSLTSVVIGDSVTSIGEDAFYGCCKLVEVVNKSSHITITKGSSSNGYFGYYALAVYNSGDAFTTKLSNDNGYIIYTDGAEKILVGYNGTETDLVLPSYITKIYQRAFEDYDSLTSVVIGNSVTSIGDWAFSDCDSLTSVVIGNSVTSIDDYAFDDCNKLVEVVNKSSHITITKGSSSNGYVGYYALAVYNSGAAFTTKLSNDNGYIIYTDGAEKILVGYNGTETDLVLPSYITKIYQRAFEDYDSLTSVVIGNSVTSIGNYVFYNCSSLTKVNYLGTIDSWAQIEFGNSESNPLYYANNLYINGVLQTEITINAETINSYAFYNCDSLTSVVIGNSVTSIGDYAFRNCSSLTSVVIGDSVTSIGDYAFRNCSSLTRVNYLGTIDSWTSIKFGGYYSNPLYYAKNLYINGVLQTEITINAEKINSYAFSGCSSLTSVTIENSVTSIGNYAFEFCSSLTSVVIGNSVTSIGDYAFHDCSSLKSVVIGDSVTSIGSWAFYGCCKLVEVVNKSSHIKITKGSSNNGYVGCYAISVFNSADSYVNKFTNDNGYIIYDDGAEKILVGYNGTETDLVLPSYITKIYKYAFEDYDSLTSIVIGNSVTSIGDYAFYDCKSLTSVTIGNGVTSIGGSAFYDCDSLTSVTIGNSVKSIGNYAFYDCDSLTSVTIGNSVKSIGNYAFYGCWSLAKVNYLGTIDEWAQISFSSYNSNPIYYAENLYINDVLQTKITINAEKINHYAFRSCSSLTSVTIGNSVTSIGEYAFYGCSDLKTVYYKGTSENWEKIIIGSYNTSLTNATRYYYVENESDLPADNGNYWHYVDGVPTVWTKD